MMNVKRHEAFTLDVVFDCGAESLRDYALQVWQHGRSVLSKGKEEAVPDAGGRRVYFTFSGEETARLRPGAPAWAQVRAVAADGGEAYSEVAELNVVDVLGGGEGRV